MKLATVRVDGRTSWGTWVEGTFVDIGANHPQLPTLRDAIESGQLSELAEAAGGVGVGVPSDQVQFLPVIPEPRQIFCVGVNYLEHRRETGRGDTEFPTIFLRLPASQVGHEQPLVKPKESARFDYEGELAVVIGQGGRRIAAADAFEHIIGYACYNDASVRDWQNHTTQWTPGKNFVGTGAFGPYLVTADEIDDIHDCSLVTLVNGEERQRAKISEMATSIADIIAYISTFTPLQPGDVIVTGTPGGVGSRRTPPTFLDEGDRIEVHIDGVGVLQNTVSVES
jgi:2-keto-4-pentenoate hydratase/2-oxohepta-3-ene-1,7-dioic acid hydratase in catechol pathway